MASKKAIERLLAPLTREDLSELPRRIEGPAEPQRKVGLPENPSLTDRAVARLFGEDVAEDPQGTTRMGTTLAGAIAGGMAGSRLPPAPGPAGLVINPVTGAIAGSALGVLGGTVAPETTMEVLEFLGMAPEGTREREGLSPEDLSTVVKGEAALELHTAGLGTASRIVTRGAGRLISGVTREASRLAQRVEEQFGIQLDLSRLSEGGVAKAIPRVIGGFPWVASIVRESSTRLAKQSLDALNGVAQRVGTPISIPERGRRAFFRAKKLVVETSKEFNQRYTKIFEAADEAGVTADPIGGLEEAQSVLNEIFLRRPDALKRIPASVPAGFTGGAGKPAHIKRVPGNLSGQLGEAAEFIQAEIMPLAPGQSLKQFDAVIAKLDDQITAFTRGTPTKKEAAGLLTRIKLALKADLREHFNGPSEIAEAMRAVDEDFSAVMLSIFENPTALKFGRVRRRGLRGVAFQAQTTTPVDQLFKIVFNRKSPAAMFEMRALVGQKEFNNIVAGHIQDITEAATSRVAVGPTTDKVTIEVGKMKKALGLEGAASDIRETMKAAFEAAGGPELDTVTELIKAIELAGTVGDQDVVTFIARRVVLSGGRGLRTVFTPLAAGTKNKAEGILGGITGLIFFRMAAQAVTEPANAKLFLRSIRDIREGKIVRGRNTLARILQNLIRQSPPGQQGLTPKLVQDILAPLQEFADFVPTVRRKIRELTDDEPQ